MQKAGMTVLLWIRLVDCGWWILFALKYSGHFTQKRCRRDLDLINYRLKNNPSGTSSI